MVSVQASKSRDTASNVALAVAVAAASTSARPLRCAATTAAELMSPRYSCNRTHDLHLPLRAALHLNEVEKG